jgi:hypothetical protein
LLLIPKADERQKNDKMLATTTTTTTHEWCRWVVVDFLCVFPIVKTANKLTTLIAKDQNFMGYKWMEIYWILMRVLYRCSCGYYYYYYCLCNVAALLAFVVQNQTFSLHF